MHAQLRTLAFLDSLWLSLAHSGSLSGSLSHIGAHFDSVWRTLALFKALSGDYWLTRSLLRSARCGRMATVFPALVTRLFRTNPLYNSSAISSWLGLFKRDGNRRLNDIKLEPYSANLPSLLMCKSQIYNKIKAFLNKTLIGIHQQSWIQN